MKKYINGTIMLLMIIGTPVVMTFFTNIIADDSGLRFVAGMGWSLVINIIMGLLNRRM